MKVGIVQFNPRLGDIEQNAEKISQFVQQARQLGAQFVLFPELALSGYPPMDLLEYDGFHRAQKEALDFLAEKKDCPALMMGAAFRNPGSLGKPFRNSAVWISKGKWKEVYSKRLLPYYDIFDDCRYFEPGTKPYSFKIERKNFSVVICEDLWNENGFLKRGYTTQKNTRKTDFLCHLSASPFELGKPLIRDMLLQKTAKKSRCVLLASNQVGANDSLLYDGGTCVINKLGEKILAAEPFTESLLIYDTQQKINPMPELNWAEEKWIVEALTAGIRDYFHKTKNRKAVIGLSGGVDSALCLLLLVRAIGKENVIVVHLPSPFTSQGSQDDAKKLSENIGIPLVKIPIQKSMEAMLTSLPSSIAHLPLVSENLQPRIRMSLLMGIANGQGALLINTSNKSELACGFATLYGDLTGALCPLGDLTKDWVYRLSRFLNQERKLIPESILTRAPSAELRKSQKDEEDLPPYQILDPMVVSCVEKFQGKEELLQSYPRKDVENFFQRYSTSEFKRAQAPLILRVTPKAFGTGRRIPIVAKHH